MLLNWLPGGVEEGCQATRPSAGSLPGQPDLPSPESQHRDKNNTLGWKAPEAGGLGLRGAEG